MSGSATDDPVTFQYRFEFGDGSAKVFEIRLDPDTLELIDQPTGPLPAWTKLDNHMCTNCPLEGKAEYCPVAVNLSHVVESFKSCISYNRAVVTVTTKERTYLHDTTVQRGLSSIIGIYNVTSNCPILDRLRPMVRFHLPFASAEETAYRAVSMYLTAQHFVMKRGGKPDWRLNELTEIYEAIAHVEEGLSGRFRRTSNDDAAVNAVIILSTFGQQIRLLLEHGLKEIEHWFSPYIDRTGPM